MIREEALQRIVNNNFAGEYGFDMQIFIDCMVVAREIIINSQFPSEDCISRAEAIKALDCEIDGSIKSDIDLSKHKREFQEFADMIINAQEKALQALPPVTPKPKTDVLEKIRAEIEQLRADLMTSGGVYEHSAYGLDYAMQIIDKYKAEKE